MSVVGADEVDDGKLIEAVLTGDREAFGPLMDRYYAMVYRACVNMTGNVPDAEELAHDSFVEAYLKLGQLRDPERFAGWLKTLTLNVCRMWYRSNKQQFVELNEDVVPAVEESPEDRSLYVKMSQGLSALSVPHRLVLALHYYEGLSYDEIAGFLEISRGTVMSRLHRARQALKGAIEHMSEQEETSVIPDDKFKEVVQAEIAVLLRMFHDEANAPERLTIVLRKSPERLAELITDAEDPEILKSLAVLLPHLGADAVDAVLDCAFSELEPRRTNSHELLAHYAARCGTMGHRDGMPDMASRDTYLLLDRLIAHRADDSDKAGILLELIESCASSVPAVLGTNVLLCYADAAFPMLMALLEQESHSTWVLQALVRTGARFGKALLEMLRDGSDAQCDTALLGFEALARSLCPPWMKGVSREQYLNDLRTQEKWAPLRIEDVGSKLIADLTQETAAIAASGTPELRTQAIRVLGYLKAAEYSELLRASLSSDDHNTRLAAIFALSEIGDTSSADELIRCAQSDDPLEQVAAITALGRLRIASAEHLLVEMTRSKEEQIREAAVAALGEMGTVSSHVAMQEIMRGNDRKLQKIAAKAVFGGRSERKIVPTDLQKRLAEKRRKVSPIAQISPDAAIRFGLTEMRSYDERDITERIASVCSDYCATRRYLIELGLMNRTNGNYEFTDNGKLIWSTEQFIRERYLMPWYQSAECD